MIALNRPLSPGSLKRLETGLSSMPILGMVVDVNPFLIDLLGYSREQFFERDLGAWVLQRYCCQ